MKMNRLHLVVLLCISFGFSVGCVQSPRPIQRNKNNPNRNPSSTSSDQPFAIQLKSAHITQLIPIYQEATGRTVLRPELTLTPFNLDIHAKNDSEAAAALTKAFEEKGLKVIPDGKKFVMIVPNENVDMAVPCSSQLKSDSAPAHGEINFPSVPLDRAAAMYAELLQRKLEPDSPLLKTPSYISIRTQAPLNKEETIYALDTLFAWQNIKLIPVCDNLIRAVEISSEKK